MDTILESIRVASEKLLMLLGVNGVGIPILRHAILLLVSILLAWLSGFICLKVLVPLVGKITRRTPGKWDDILLNRRVLVSASHIVPAIVVWALVPLVFYQYPHVRVLLDRITEIYITVMSTRTLLVFISGFNRLDDAPNRSKARQYFRSLCSVLRVVVLFLAVIIVVAIIINKSPMKLIAGLGATSAVLMLIFKDTITGLVAGIRLTSNDMVHKGDWITVPGPPANGIVQDMSLSTVKIRNFDNTIVTVTPNQLITGTFQNWIGMQESDGRLVQRRFYVDFKTIHFEHSDDGDDITNLGRYRAAIEEYLNGNEHIQKKMGIMVRQLEATDCGLPIEVRFFLKYKEWKVYEDHLARIMEHVYAMAPDYGVKLYEQYPEQ